MPQRVQRKREYGWRAGTAIIVDRSSRYGNPWRILDDTLVIAPDDTMRRFPTPVEARKEATTRFRAWLRGEGFDNWQVGRKVFSRKRILTDLWRLRGRDMACMCPLPEPGQPDYCHATVLMEFAEHPERLAE